MKRLIAVLLLLSMIVAAGFAQVSGAVDTRMYLLDTYFSDEEDFKQPLHIYGLISAASITLTGVNENRTIGGQLRLTVEYDTRNSTLNWPWHKAYVWWQPVPQFKMFLGQDPDGQFENAVLAGYDYHQGNEQYIGIMLWDFWRAVFPGNWDTFGLAFSIRPIRELQINLIIPTGGPEVLKWPRHEKEHVQRKVDWRNMFPWGLRINATGLIPGVGSVMFSYIGPEHFATETPSEGFEGSQGIKDRDGLRYNHVGDFGLSFLLNGPVPGLQVQVGASTKFRSYSDYDTYPIMLGLAAHYQTNTGGYDWGVKFRYGVSVNTTYKMGTSNFAMSQGGEIDDTFMHGSVMPWINVRGWKINLDMGMTALVNKYGLAHTNSRTGATEDDKTLWGWWISPYVKYGPLEVGFHIMTAGDHAHLGTDDNLNDNAAWSIHKLFKEPKIKIAIPIRMVFHF